MSALSAAASDEDGDIIKNLQARVADLEAQLYAVGAGGVGSTVARQGHPEQHLEMVPAGWKLVPVEPTRGMCVAGAMAGVKHGDVPYFIYLAMLAAAPQPPAVEQPQVEQQTRYLAGGARYKVTHLKTSGYCIIGLPAELLGQWVALVDATDNKHMDSQQPQSVTNCHQSQPQGGQEPVAWIENIGGGVSYNPYHEAARKLPDGVRFDLYTRPQPCQPLTDAQINGHRLALPYDGEDLPDPWDFKQGVRAAERAHRIGGEA